MAVREYDGRTVPDETVRRIADAGRLSASAMNRQPWHFVVVRDRPLLRRLGGLVSTGPYIADCAFAIVVAYRRDGSTAVADATRAIQSMVLTAWAEGVASNWAGFAGGLGEVRAEVGLPAEYDVLAVLTFGYPARPPRGRKKRRPAAEVISADRFGTPL